MTTPAPATESNSAATGIAAWRILLRMLAGFLAMFSFAFWAAAGWNLGWTKDRITIMQTDEVTGITYPTYKDHFMPGVELFGPALLLCVVLFGITFIRRKNTAARN